MEYLVDMVYLFLLGSPFILFPSSVDTARASQRGTVAKSPLPMQENQETRAQSQGWEDALEQETATHSSILAWRATVHGVLRARFPQISKSRT